MKKKELIRALLEIPDDMEIYIKTDGHDYGYSHLATFYVETDHVSGNVYAVLRPE